jgi:hypothetical protein
MRVAAPDLVAAKRINRKERKDHKEEGLSAKFAYSFPVAAGWFTAEAQRERQEDTEERPKRLSLSKSFLCLSL